MEQEHRMRSVSARELLSVWELTVEQSPFRKAMAMLSAAYPEATEDALTQMSIGERDTRLLGFRERLFGSRMSGLATCPQCGERIELSFDVRDILPDREVQLSEKKDEDVMKVTVESYEVQFRLPNSLDLAAIVPGSNKEEARAQLLERCIVAIEHGPRGGQQGSDGIAPQDLGSLPEAVLRAINERMAQADPQGDTQLVIVCPKCQHEWKSYFDIAFYLEKEIHAWAQRLLTDIHLLASAYGWSEAEILGMSSIRRQAYLQMLGYA
jgi:hypothetical protein